MKVVYPHFSGSNQELVQGISIQNYSRLEIIYQDIINFTLSYDYDNYAMQLNHFIKKEMNEWLIFIKGFHKCFSKFHDDDSPSEEQFY